MQEKWVAAWGCPIVHLKKSCAEWMRNTTIRFTVLPTVPGRAVRLHFSNRFGQEPATITRASIGKSAGEQEMDLSCCVPVTFGGAESGRMEPGGALVSDAAALSFEAGEPLVINLYFEDFTPLTTGQNNSGAYIKKWAATGDCTRLAALPLNHYAEADAYPFIHTLEVCSAPQAQSIIAFGDSITAQTWPDQLARRLLELGKTDRAVVRRGISGSRVLREYACDFYRHYGPRGIDRFEQEILAAGAGKVFILHGINDIIHPDEADNPFRPASDLPRAEDLIAGLQTYIDIAHRHQLSVYLAPILPFEGWRTYSPEREQIREQVNLWIYRQAQVEGVLPFETAVLNPENPLALLPEYDSGDHLHPSLAGAHALAYSIPEEWL